MKGGSQILCHMYESGWPLAINPLTYIIASMQYTSSFDAVHVWMQEKRKINGKNRLDELLDIAHVDANEIVTNKDDNEFGKKRNNGWYI